MNIEKELIISLLKLTKNGTISFEVARKEAKITRDVGKDLIKSLEDSDLVYLQNEIVNVDSLKRLKLAVRAIHLGADLERVSGFLDWKEFESITAIAFGRNGYRVKKNLRFKHGGRRLEIDIVGCKEPISVCVDCKHWHYGMYPSTIKRIVEKQVERTLALAECWSGLAEEFGWEPDETVKLVPAVLCLTTARFKFYNRVPVVPILQLQNFISQLPAHLGSLKHFIR